MVVQHSAYHADGMQEWRAERLLRRGVVDARRAEVLGEVADVVFDLQRQQLAGLLIGPAGAAGLLLEGVRSTFGGTPMGLRLMEAQHIVALKKDVVVVDDHSSGHASTTARTPLPRLTEMHGLAVVTVEGQQIGQFVDVLLTREGRVIAGYLVEAAAHEAAAHDGRPHPASHQPHAQAQVQARQPARQDASRPLDADALIVLAAATPIRLGREVIIVGDLESQRHPLAAPSTSAPAVGNETPSGTPAADAPNGYPPEWPAPETDAVTMPGPTPPAAPWPAHERGGAWPDAPTQP